MYRDFIITSEEKEQKGQVFEKKCSFRISDILRSIHGRDLCSSIKGLSHGN